MSEQKAYRYHCGPYGVCADAYGDWAMISQLPKEVQEKYVMPKPAPLGIHEDDEGGEE